MGTNAINTTQSTFTSGQLVSKNYTDSTFTKCPSEQLKIIRGTVNSAGTALSGLGYLSILIGGTTAQYRISFPSNPFAGTQLVSVVVTPTNSLFPWVYANNTNNTTNQYFEVAFGNTTGQLAVNFSFIAIAN